jgi:hypothetical protein
MPDPVQKTLNILAIDQIGEVEGGYEYTMVVVSDIPLDLQPRDSFVGVENPYHAPPGRE